MLMGICNFGMSNHFSAPAFYQLERLDAQLEICHQGRRGWRCRLFGLQSVQAGDFEHLHPEMHQVISGGL